MATKKESKHDGTFDLQWIEVSKLRPAKYNPRKDLKPGDPEYESLKKSINEFGLVDPIVVNKDMTVIGGHQRLKIIVAAGFDKVPCSVVNLDKQHEKLLNIALNKISGDWDLPILRDLIISLDDGSLDMSITGFNSHELELMMTAIKQDEPADAEPQMDKAAELNKVWKVATGDLWQIGSHRLLAGDSTKAEDVARVMGGEKAALLFTDPPYGVDVVGSGGNIGGDTRNAKAGKYHAVIGDDKPFTPAHLFDLADSLIIWGANYFCLDLPSIGQWIVWDKNRPDGTTFSECELAWTNGKGIAIKKYKCTWDGFHREGESGARFHPTQKPVKLTEDILNDFGGDIVIDPYLGSGTTMVACQNLNRKCRGIEISPDYCAVILQRMTDAFPNIEIRRIDQ